MSNHRVAILAAASGYTAEQLELFLKSISAFSPTASVTLFVDEARPSVAALARTLRCKVELRSRSPIRRWIDRRINHRFRLCQLIAASAATLPQKSHARNSLTGISVAPHVGRYFDYLGWLRTNASRHDIAYCLDSRDIVVLSDLSKVDLPGLTFGSESAILRDEPCNQAWLYAIGHPAQRVYDLLDNSIICSGAFGGPTATVLRFCESMCEMARANVQAIGRLSGMDQGLLQWMIYGERTLSPTIYNPGDGIIVNLGTSNLEDAARLQLHPFNGGRLPVVLHQYDRIPEIKTAVTGFVRRRFSENVLL